MAEPAAARPIIRELPPEIWKKIFSSLDDPELLTCRLVNKCWKDLATDVIREKSSMWKPTFQTVTESISKRCGTRFSKPHEINQFMTEMEGIPSPFPNGTAIFIPDEGIPQGRVTAYPDRIFMREEDQVTAFQENLCDLLSAFGDQVSNLVYAVHMSRDEIDFFHQMQNILNLKNLKSLTLGENPQWGWCYLKLLKSSRCHDWIEQMLEWEELTLPDKLTELRLLGMNGVIPLFCLFERIKPILNSIENLEISNTDLNHYSIPDDPHNRRDYPMPQLPNLKKFKVRFPDVRFLEQFTQFQPNCVASLKEVSFHFDINQASKIRVNLSGTLELLDYHAEALELLHLDFVSGYWGKANDARNFHEVNTSVKYRKVKRLILQHEVIHFWPTVFAQLVAKVVNLQEFELILAVPGTYDEQISLRDQLRKVEDCWDILPPTVGVIRVPNYGWKVKRGESLQFGE